MVQIYDIQFLKNRFVDQYDSEDEDNIKQREKNMADRK